MRITESKLRRIIRSVIRESMHDFDPSNVPPHPDDMGLIPGTPEYEDAMDKYEEYERQERQYMRDTMPMPDSISKEESDRIMPPGPHGYREY